MLKFVCLSWVSSGITYSIIYIFLNCIDTLQLPKIPENSETKYKFTCGHTFFFLYKVTISNNILWNQRLDCVKNVC